MASTDIFNPNTGWDAVLGFNANWSYGSPRKTGSNYQTSRPKFGPWTTRSVGDAGYSFDLTFTGRPIQQVRYIKRFFEQFQTGYFTLIDHDNGGRQHVGRFTGDPEVIETSNLQYTIRVTFEEIPGCIMQVYPSDWAGSSHWIYAVDDFLNPTAMTGLAASSTGEWYLGQNYDAYEAGVSTNDPSSYQQLNLSPSIGDFAQVEYIGWGFQMTFPLSPLCGLCDLVFDNNTSVNNLDLSSGAVGVSAPSIGSFGPATVTSTSTTVTVTLPYAPLGRHRLKLIALGQPGSASAAAAPGTVLTGPGGAPVITPPGVHPLAMGGARYFGTNSPGTGVTFPGLQVIH